MDDRASVRFDPSPAVAPRAGALRQLTVFGTGRWHAPLGGRPGARFIAVHGGGSVGKSTVAANLAIAVAGLRSRVVLLDLDLRRPTQHRLFGLAAPAGGLRALLDSQIDTIEQALTPTAVRNLYLVSAEGARPPTEPTNPARQHRLLEQIWELDADVVIADVGTDPADELVDLFSLGALRLIVSTPDARSIRRGYNLFKAQIVREIEHVTGGTAEGALLAAAMADPRPRVMRDLLGTLVGKPHVRAALEHAFAAFGGRLIGNRVRNTDEADLIHAASRLIADYLGIAVPVLGIVEASAHIEAPRAPGRPLLLSNGIDHNVRLFHSMAEQLLMDAAETEAPRCVTRAEAGPEVRSCATEKPARAEGSDGTPLPVSLGGYMRRHPRHAVDWYARYVSASGRETAVRVFEVSQVGASIECLPGFDIGDEGRLIFSQIAGQPELPVTVVDARRPLHRAGLRFEGHEEVGARLAALAADVASQRAAPVSLAPR